MGITPVDARRKGPSCVGGIRPSREGLLQACRWRNGLLFLGEGRQRQAEGEQAGPGPRGGVGSWSYHRSLGVDHILMYER